MTRRPIFIGVTAILALALTAGLAYGAGRLVANGTPGSRSARQQLVGATSAMPAAYSTNRTQAIQGAGYGPAFMSQMRQWMQDWMRNHGWSRQFWARARYGQVGPSRNVGSYSGGYVNSGSHGHWDDHHASSGSWGGPTSGGYGYGDHRYDHGHDCW